MTTNTWSRREAMLAAAALATTSIKGLAREATMAVREIPASGERLPVIGLGTYSVFDVASSPEAIATRQAIVRALTDAGGSVLDTSPMYNRSERVIGELVDSGTRRDSLFIATKVWTDGRAAGVAQMQRSSELMNSEVIDLMQVHNLRDTDVHLATIREWQERDRIRYNGLTHYTAGAHAALEAAMQRHRPDFIQINYSLGEREAGERLLPLAQELGIAVLINRPFQAGRLFAAVSGRELPDWAASFAASWGQFFLKFIIGHPAVTCVIPATSKLRHMRDNVEAGFGPLPDTTTRKRMVAFVETL
jgi:aryl-alcohol dehydrogenase-like predicted oxidoreductase